MDEITKVVRSVNARIKKDQKEVTICIVIICKQEEKIIRRCLDSTRSVGDFWCICDTGSTDKTMSIVEEWFDYNKVEGCILKHKWINFGHNRSLSIKTAEYYYPNSTYHLHIDCDMILKIGKSWNKNVLMRDSYSFEQTNGNQTYSNIRLTKASLSWRSSGVTHEYYNSDAAGSTEYLPRNMIWIDDINDGGSKNDKYTRDYSLLSKGIKDEPGNERYIFYMGQTLRELDRWREAIKYYTQRIEMEGYEEEIYYSYYRRGDCYEKIDEWGNALASYLQAYDHTPARSESLYEIINYYRHEEDYHTAALFYKTAMKIKRPKQLHLFIDDSIYDHQIEYEYSVIAYYVGDVEGGIRSIKNVLKSNAPNHLKRSVDSNMEWYHSG